MLKSFGHENVRVLDGGLGKFKADGGQLESAAIPPTAEDFDYSIFPLKVNTFE